MVERLDLVSCDQCRKYHAQVAVSMPFMKEKAEVLHQIARMDNRQINSKCKMHSSTQALPKD